VSTSEPWRRPGTSEITDRQTPGVGRLPQACRTYLLTLHASVAFPFNLLHLAGSYNTQSTLVGLEIRVYQSGQLFAGCAHPSTLLREKVDQSRRGVMVIGNGLVDDRSS